MANLASAYLAMGDKDRFRELSGEALGILRSLKVPEAAKFEQSWSEWEESTPEAD